MGLEARPSSFVLPGKDIHAITGQTVSTAGREMTMEAVPRFADDLYVTDPRHPRGATAMLTTDPSWDHVTPQRGPGNTTRSCFTEDMKQSKMKPTAKYISANPTAFLD